MSQWKSVISHDANGNADEPCLKITAFKSLFGNPSEAQTYLSVIVQAQGQKPQ